MHPRTLGAAVDRVRSVLPPLPPPARAPLLGLVCGLRPPEPLLGAGEDLFAVAVALAVVTAGRDPG
jgi:hypothetical protein